MRIQYGACLVAVLAAVAAGFGCADAGRVVGGQTADTVEVTPGTSVLGVGNTERLSAVALDAQGHSILGATVVWQSRDPAIATVDATGLVHAVSPGTATIIASAAGGSGSAQVQVDTTGGPGLSGYHLAFSTYLGGISQDQIRDVAVDAQNNVYITGGSESPTFPTTLGSYDPTPNGNYDVFVSKISPTGQLLWSTLIGGPNYDRAYAIEVDAQGFIYLAGRAGAGFPVTAGAFQTAFAGGPNNPPYGPQDGFVCKMTPDGTSIVFCSYFGTNDAQMIRDLAVDAQGGIYVASSHVSGSFPSSWFTGSYRSTPVGGVDAVIAKIAPDGASVEWATFVGGTADEGEQPSLRRDASGNLFALYSTQSTDAPTPNGFDHTLGGFRDLYLIKLSGDGTQLLFGTYAGGSGGEDTETHELALDPQGNPVIGNGTPSSDLPVTAGVIQPTLSGPKDAFIMRVSADGSQVLTCTYFGGNQDEKVEGIDIDPAGNIYITGQTSTIDLAYLKNGFQGSAGSLGDMMVVKLSPDLRTVLYGSYLGGNDLDRGRAAAVSPSGAFVFAGTTQSSNFLTLNAIQLFPGGILDAVVAFIVPN